MKFFFYKFTSVHAIYFCFHFFSICYMCKLVTSFCVSLPEDGHVTKAEFVSLWMSMTHMNQEHAGAYFYLADLNDDNIIDDHDLNPLYNVFDTDGIVHF